MVIYSSKNQKIEIVDTPLNSGGEGSVHLIKNNQKHCVKIYHKEKRTEDRRKKLEYMVQNAPSKLFDKRYIICWPLDVVYDINQSFLGFIMPLAYKDSILCYELTKNVIDNSLPSIWNETYSRKTNKGFDNRLKLLVNIAIPFAIVHDMERYVFVDLKPDNMLITPNGEISVIDLDSIQIHEGSNLFLCPVYTPTYYPPELHSNPPAGTPVDVSCDLFALAVIYYQILFGIHPFQCTSKDTELTEIRHKIQAGLFHYGPNAHKIEVVPSPHQKFQYLPSVIKLLFKQAFGCVPNQRPSVKCWAKTMYEFLMQLNKQQ